MNGTKYVRSEEGEIIICSSKIHHADFISVRLRQAERKNMFERFHPVSAGFFHIVNGVVHTSGMSESLQMEPFPDDAQLIADVLGLSFETYTPANQNMTSSTKGKPWNIDGIR